LFGAVVRRRRRRRRWRLQSAYQLVRLVRGISLVLGVAGALEEARDHARRLVRVDGVRAAAHAVLERAYDVFENVFVQIPQQLAAYILDAHGDMDG